MNNENDDNEKQFEPSQKKLDDARKKGEIAKSADLNTAASYAGLLVVMLSVGPVALDGLATTLSATLSGSDTLAIEFFAGSAHSIFGGILYETFIGTLPWFTLPAVFALLSVFAQKAFLVTPSKIMPKLTRISPVSGIKNKFGRQGLFEFFKSMTKLIIYSIVMAFFLSSQSDRILNSAKLPANLVMYELGHIILGLMWIVFVVALVLGAIDYLWQRGEHIRKNKMSRKEMMEELKQAEGDPIIKQQRRQKGQEIAMNKMLTEVPEANVVIVNPTHYSVALKWNINSGAAPICVAKGVDEIAAKIRELAYEYEVPIHSDPPTARALHSSVEIGQEIKPEHYKAVAAAIRFAEGIRQKART